MLTAPSARPCAWSIRDGMPKPSRRDAVERQLAHDRGELVEQRRLRGRHGRPLDRLVHRPVLVDDARENLGPAEVDADHTWPVHGAGNLPRRMAREEKPYRVYRGGRAKGKVPTVRPARVRSSDEGKGGGVADYRGPGTSTPKRARWGLSHRPRARRARAAR